MKFRKHRCRLVVHLFVGYLLWMVCVQILYYCNWTTQSIQAGNLTINRNAMGSGIHDSVCPTDGNGSCSKKDAVGYGSFHPVLTLAFYGDLTGIGILLLGSIVCCFYNPEYKTYRYFVIMCFPTTSITVGIFRITVVVVFMEHVGKQYEFGWKDATAGYLIVLIGSIVVTIYSVAILILRTPRHFISKEALTTCRVCGQEGRRDTHTYFTAVTYTHLNSSNESHSSLSVDLDPQHPLSTRNFGQLSQEVRTVVNELWRQGQKLIAQSYSKDRNMDIQIESVESIGCSFEITKSYNHRKRNMLEKVAFNVGGRLKSLEEYKDTRKDNLANQFTCAFGNVAPIAENYGEQFKKPVATSSLLSRNQNLKSLINMDINEVYLFYRVKLSTLTELQQAGLAPNEPKDKFWPGVSFSDYPVSMDKNTCGTGDGYCYMIMARVLLGDIVVLNSDPEICKDAHGPPCKTCFVPGSCNQGYLCPRFDSLVYDGTPLRNYVVYGRDRALPEFFIKYKVAKPSNGEWRQV